MLKKYNSYLRENIPFLYGAYLKLSEIRSDKKYIGELKNFGVRNPDKTFLIIRINNHGMGLMAIFNCVMGYIRIANKYGYEAVVDLKNYKNGYLEENEIGLVNAWENYFEQPSGYSLDEAYESKNVYIATGNSTIESSPIPLKYYYLFNKKKAKKYYNIIQNQMSIRTDICNKIDQEYKDKLFGKRVIGVKTRGSDLVNAPGHAVQPTMEELLTLTKKKLVEWNCEYVFLATEEAETVEIFESVFKDKLLLNESARVKEYDNKSYLVDISFGRKRDKYHKGLEYLTTVKLLSNCNCLIGSAVGATVGALGLNMGEYEHVYIYELGTY